VNVTVLITTMILFALARDAYGGVVVGVGIDDDDDDDDDEGQSVRFHY